jgi:hypothetical protein
MKAHWATLSPEARAQQVAAMRAAMPPPDVKWTRELRRAQGERGGVRLARLWQDPEWRRRQDERKRRPRPEHSAFMKAHWETLSPDEKHRWIAAMVRRGAANGQWKGGRINDGSYIRVRVGGQYRREHRLIAERALGRPLARDEVVHHINSNPLDNRPENLLICSKSYHHSLEHRIRRRRTLASPPPAQRRKPRRASAKK